MTTSLTGRHAVVTGGGRGIGLAIARGLLAHGATVTLLSRDRARLEKSAATLAGEVMIEVADVASPAQVAERLHQPSSNARVPSTSSSTTRARQRPALPTGFTVGPTYYVSATGLAAGTFQVSGSPGGASINTTGTQSGTHSAFAV